MFNFNRSNHKADRKQRVAAPVPMIEPLESRQLLSAAPLHAAVKPAAVKHVVVKPVVVKHVAAKPVAKPAAKHVAVKPVVVKHVPNFSVKNHPFNTFIISPEAKRRGKPSKLTVNVPITGAYTPAQVRTAYGVGALGVANQGQGITIGIVDELNDPDITGDAAAFSTEYNLPKFDGIGGDPTLTVFEDQALGTVASAAGTDIGAETCLDVEWAHAMAPMANILLVEVPATGSVANDFTELLHGVQVAAQKGAQSVSLSYGYAEATIGGANVISQNNTYLAAGAAVNVAVSVSSGDASSPLFPATSPNVVAVGGSSLYLSSVKGHYSFETAWGGLTGSGAGGGGSSAEFSTPTFQSANGVNFGNRSIPDVAMIADPVTGVSVYDTLDDAGGNPWTAIGGTSLASPVFAGIIALAQQNRVAAAKPILTSLQINNEIYAVYNSPSYSTYFHDITLGNNKNVNSSGTTTVTGHSATTGYDQATGVGSPIANTFVPLLSSL